MRKHLLIFAAAALVAGCKSETTQKQSPPKAAAPIAVAPAKIGKLEKVVSDGNLYFGGQPSADDLKEAKALGITTIVNLRPRGEWPYDEAGAARELGLQLVEIPVTPATLSANDAAKLRDALGTAGGKVLIHCGSGNRVGGLWALHKRLHDGVEIDAAIAEGKAVGLSAAPLEARVRDLASKPAK